MHPWHDVYIDEDQLTETFPVVIEVPMRTKNTCELDKESGLLRLDRVMFSAVHYPASFGEASSRRADRPSMPASANGR